MHPFNILFCHFYWFLFVKYNHCCIAICTSEVELHQPKFVDIFVGWTVSLVINLHFQVQCISILGERTGEPTSLFNLFAFHNFTIQSFIL